jgi:hypothetical protein
MPRFMEASGPTDPMALLMRQRIVFLGTQARVCATRAHGPTCAAVPASARRCVARARRAGAFWGQP